MAELDAAESKRRKTEQDEIAKEAFLCLVTYEQLFVIKLSKLKKEVDVKDWTSMPKFHSDFAWELPERELCPFEFDSKIYMASSDVPPGIRRRGEPWPIYEFKFQGGIVPTESLDGAPFPFRRSFIANTPGSGDVYLYIDRKSSGFYVLCSGSRVWKPLSVPPALGDPLVRLSMFDLHNNLFFLSTSAINKTSLSARFDPIEQIWATVPAANNNLSNFITSRNNHGTITYHPRISVSLPGLGSSNYTVCVAHEYVEEPCSEKVFAILVNHQNGSVALYQYLDMCFEGIQPRVADGARFNFVDLGNGKLCAILHGYLSDPKSDYESVICISVFTLSVLKDFAALQLDSGTPPMERDFLEVAVHSKSAYTANWECDYTRHAFVWPPTKGGRFQHRTTQV